MRGGAALSLCKVLNLPIRFIGTGEKFQTLTYFTLTEWLTEFGNGRCFKIFSEKAKKFMTHRKQIIWYLGSKGDFTLDDLMQNLAQIN